MAVISVDTKKKEVVGTTKTEVGNGCRYPTGREVSDEEMKCGNLEANKFQFSRRTASKYSNIPPESHCCGPMIFRMMYPLRSITYVSGIMDVP